MQVAVFLRFCVLRVSIYLIQAEKILLIQLRQVGDVLLTTPAVKAVRDAYPYSEISYLTETGPAQLLQNNPHIDYILPRKRKQSLLQDLKLAYQLRRTGFDLVVDFFCNPRSAWMSFFTGATHRIAAYHASRAWWYSHTPRIQSGFGYAAEDKLALLRAIGIKAELVHPILHVLDDARSYVDNFLTQRGLQDQTPLITIDATSRRQARRWIAERYVELADRLVETQQAAVVFIWGPGEREEVAALVRQGKHTHTLACDMDLMQLAALIERSTLHIGNCSAPNHIATAVGTPSLIVMGPTSPENWIYPSPIHRFVRGDVPCLACQRVQCAPHDCMQALTVDEVEREAVQLLNEQCAMSNE